MSKTQSIARALVPAIAIAAAATLGSAATAASFSEGFDVVGSSWSSWRQLNNSTLIGDEEKWAQGCSSTCPFSAYAGTPAGAPGTAGSFIKVDFDSTRDGNGPETIDNWLILPTMTFNNGDLLKFYTRGATEPYADSLEVRFGTGALPSPGNTTGSVGSFDTMLLAINPSLVVSAYPTDWTEYTVQIPVLSPTTGAIAFRYYIVDGGPGQNRNSNIVGIDSLSITAGPPITPVPEPAVYLMMALGLAVIGLRRMHAMRD